MRRILNFVPVQAFLLAIIGMAIWLGIVQSNAHSESREPKNLQITESKQVNDAFANSDLVVIGTITGVRNYAPTDGGYGYDIAVSDVLKGNQMDTCSIRAGGWAYTIRFSPEDEVLLFLRQSDAFLPQERFVLALDASHKPLAFRIRAGRIVGVEPHIRQEWEGRSIQEIRDIRL